MAAFFLDQPAVFFSPRDLAPPARLQGEIKLHVRTRAAAAAQGGSCRRGAAAGQLALCMMHRAAGAGSWHHTKKNASASRPPLQLGRRRQVQLPLPRRQLLFFGSVLLHCLPAIVQVRPKQNWLTSLTGRSSDHNRDTILHDKLSREVKGLNKTTDLDQW